MMVTASELNHLSGQASAYLRSAAHQAVIWYPWGEEAFARAKELDRPILLDIGAAWCHWCHVMDGESYDDPHTAAIINEHFVAIKVDRDERSDVDRRYQEAVSALTGQGGWPLTAFLTPDGQVFFGGTYFPRDAQHGRRGFSEVLLRVAEYYHTQRDSAVASALRLSEALAVHGDRVHPGSVSAALVDRGIDRIMDAFDPVDGGFGGAPKFSHPAAVELLLNRYFFSSSTEVEQVIRQTLTKMARGGIYDQVGGGFHRYSTDGHWIVPHFEKMLCDNTELLRCYVIAAVMLHEPSFAATAQGIVAFLTDVLCDRINGGFYASQDADVGQNDDGDYFTWSLDEVRAVCAPDEVDVLAERFDVRARGEMRHDSARNVLHIAADVDVVAARLGKTEDIVETLLRSALAKLRDARRLRPTPTVDRAIYTAWNGMAVSAFLMTADLLQLTSVENDALRILDRLMAACILPDGQVRHAVDVEDPSGLLEDGVFLARALLDGYERSACAEYLLAARRIVDDMLRRLWDDRSGAFCDRAPGGDRLGLLGQRRTSIEDAPTPSANAAGVEVLVRLSRLTGESVYADKARRLLEAFAGSAADLGLSGASYYRALDFFMREPAVAVVIGPADDPVAGALWAAARRVYRPYKLMLRLCTGSRSGAIDPHDLADSHLPSELRAMITSGRSSGYFCAGRACAQPTEEPGSFAQTIAGFRREA